MQMCPDQQNFQRFASIGSPRPKACEVKRSPLILKLNRDSWRFFRRSKRRIPSRGMPRNPARPHPLPEFVGVHGVGMSQRGFSLDLFCPLMQQFWQARTETFAVFRVGGSASSVRGSTFTKWYNVRHEGCSKGPCKEGTIGNTPPVKGVLTKQGTYIMAILGTGILNNYHMEPALAAEVLKSH